MGVTAVTSVCVPVARPNINLGFFWCGLVRHWQPEAAAPVRGGANQPLGVLDSQPSRPLGVVPADAETAKQGALLKPWMHLMLMRRAQPHPQSHLGPMRPLGRVPHGGHFPAIKCFSNWFFTRLGQCCFSPMVQEALGAKKRPRAGARGAAKKIRGAHFGM